MLYKGKEKAVEEILKADKKIAYNALVKDISNSVHSKHSKKKEFYAKISEFVNSRSSDPDIETLKETLIFINISHQTLLHFVVNHKCIKAFKAILENMDEGALEIAKKKILEQDPTIEIVDNETVLNAKKIAFDKLFKEIFTTKVQHNIFYQRTPLELCIYHYNQCSDYQSKSAEDKKITKDVKEVLDPSAPDTKGFWDYTKDEDFKTAKGFIETILNSARENGILKDVLTASGIRKDLAKELSDSNKQYNNDIIINVLRKNQKAEERGTTTGVVIALVGLILAVVLASWIVILATVFTSAVIGCATYTYTRPSTEILKTYANQEVDLGTSHKA